MLEISIEIECFTSLRLTKNFQIYTENEYIWKKVVDFSINVTLSKWKYAISNEEKHSYDDV